MLVVCAIFPYILGSINALISKRAEETNRHRKNVIAIN